MELGTRQGHGLQIVNISEGQRICSLRDTKRTGLRIWGVRLHWDMCSRGHQGQLGQLRE